MLRQMKTETIQDIALKLVQDQMNNLQLENEPKERTLLVLGSKGVGKTTIINKFLDQDDHIRPTIALNYSFARRTYSTEHQLKQLMNIWEICAVNDDAALIELPFRIQSHSIKSFSAIIMVDLSQPRDIVKNVKAVYQNLKTCSAKKESVGKDANSLPFSVVLVGGKYDLFMNTDNTLKVHICKGLRSICQFIGAALMFYSIKVPKLWKMLRDTITHLGFGSPSNPFRVLNTDPNDALCIWFGKDSWEAIDIEPYHSFEEIENAYALGWRQQDVESFEEPSNYSGKETSLSSIRDQNFAESEIDDLYEQKMQEIHNLVREMSQQQQQQQSHSKDSQ